MEDGIERRDFAQAKTISTSHRKTLRWDPSVHDSTNRSIHREANTKFSTTTSPPPIRRIHRSDSMQSRRSPSKSSPSLASKLFELGKRTVVTEEYHVESWNDFHKKYSSQSYRTTHCMSMSEIRRAQRRQAKPSFTQRLLQRLSRQSNKCTNCGSSQCDATCSLYSTTSSTRSGSHKKKKKSLSPFRRRKKK